MSVKTPYSALFVFGMSNCGQFRKVHSHGIFLLRLRYALYSRLCVYTMSFSPFRRFYLKDPSRIPYHSYSSFANPSLSARGNVPCYENETGSSGLLVRYLRTIIVWWNWHIRTG